ncbi:MAG: FHA domain-containing protein [Planctomycetes bacterium]|nr:FHA domain-containing protein [Planctomycetota bacterium]
MHLYIKSDLPPSSAPQRHFDLVKFFDQSKGPVKFWIGRDDDCQLKIADEKISRHHCYIERTKEGSIKLVDNNSTNGFTVNGIKVAETILTDNDAICIRHYEMALKKELVAGNAADKPHAILSTPQFKMPEHAIRKHKKHAEDNSFRLLVTVFFLVIGIVLLAILFSENKTDEARKGDWQATEKAKKNQSPGASSGGQTEAKKTDIPKQSRPSSTTTTISGGDSPARKTDEEFERQQKIIKEQRDRQDAERQAKLKAATEKQTTSKQRQEEQRLMAMEQARWTEVKATAAQEIAKYQYTGAIKCVAEFINTAKTASIEEDARDHLDNIKGESSLFAGLVKSLTGGSSRKKIVLDTSYEVWITKATEIGFEGNVAGLGDSVYYRQWKDTPTAAILNLFPRDLGKLERFYSATFCYNHNLTSDGERILIYCFRAYPDQKDRFSQFLARYKNIPLPDGGFAEYQGQLVTAEDKSYLEKGYVKYNDRWMPYDDMMTAKGLVKFQGKWVTPDEKAKIEARLAALTSLKKQLAPKGMIDKTGADKEQLPWDKARIKETEHYIIKANISQESIDDLCFLMECFYFEAKKIFKVTRDPGTKLKIFVFKNDKEYYANGGSSGSRGIFRDTGSDKQIMTFYQPPLTTSVLLHEGTHQFVNIACSNVPIWINEGLATYYESSKFEGTALKTNIVNNNRLQLIRDLILKKDVPRLEDIINIRQANFTIYEYAHCWSLVYFFMNYSQGQYADELEAYFEAIKRKGFENRPQHKQLFENIFKVKFEVLEKQWEDYILKLR